MSLLVAVYLSNIFATPATDGAVMAAAVVASPVGVCLCNGQVGHQSVQSLDQVCHAAARGASLVLCSCCCVGVSDSVYAVQQ
jgi:hypothetical protein